MLRNIKKIKALCSDFNVKRYSSLRVILISKENHIKRSKFKSLWICDHFVGLHISSPCIGINNNSLPNDGLDVQDGYMNAKKSTYTMRSNTCGELGLENIGEKVILYGWLEYHRMNKFLTLRDGYGVTQIIIPMNKQKQARSLENVPYESVLKIIGTVQARPKDMINPKQKTGEIEVVMESFEIVNAVQEKLPFDIRSFNKAKEHIRLQHRYLDLRFPKMQSNLRLRSEMLLQMRKYLIEKHFFVEVETPTLFSRTPGGAQEFIVPTRIEGEFYSLVQSPQQFKQMLMAGSIDRYFQFARCYRDEGARPDRQPEFTQLDIELSYPEKDGILELVEHLLDYSWPSNKGTIKIPFRRMAYDEAMLRYGSDKPDIRFGFELADITENVSLNPNVIKTFHKFGCYMIRVPNSFPILPKSVKNSLLEFSKKYPDVKFIQSVVNADGAKDWCNSTLANLFGEETLKRIANEHQLQPNDVIFIAYGNQRRAQTLLGKIRILYKEQLESHKISVPKTVDEEWNFLWITDFPLFTVEFDEKLKEDILTSTHHPFTAPHPEDMHNLSTDPSNVRSQAYDLVLNGSEIGGGSIRIHDVQLQKQILTEYLKINYHHLNHLIKALGSGCPPHGGIALGIDRLIAIICEAVSIRDVIAFPKSVDGRDPLSGAPVPISEEEKALYHIQSIDKSFNRLDNNNANIAANK